MALDLNKLKTKTFELKLLDGRVINIKKPNEDLIVEMENFEKEAPNSKCVQDVFKKIKALTLIIINRNTEGVVFDYLFFEQKGEDGELLYDYTVCAAIFAEYSKFTRGVLANPN
nr:MAG TPA: hypothetical protein [Caudoviricetes sp.]